MLHIVFLMFLESFWQGGGYGLGFKTFGLVVQKFLNIEWFFTNLKKNRSWKFRRNWNVPLVLLERSWWKAFNGIYLVRFGFKMWEILILKWFLHLKIQINSKKSGFGRKNQLKDVVPGNTWANGTGHTSITRVTLLTTNLQLITLVFFGACVHNALV